MVLAKALASRPPWWGQSSLTQVVANFLVYHMGLLGVIASREIARITLSCIRPGERSLGGVESPFGVGSQSEWGEFSGAFLPEFVLRTRDLCTSKASVQPLAFMRDRHTFVPEALTN